MTNKGDATLYLNGALHKKEVTPDVRRQYQLLAEGKRM